MGGSHVHFLGKAVGSPLWLPAYGMMAAMSIPVSCVGVKTHVFMDDLVVAHWTADLESTTPLDFLWRHDL